MPLSSHTVHVPPSRLALFLLFTLLLALPQTHALAVSLSAPEQVNADSPLNIGLEGVNNPRDFITIVKPDESEGRYNDYEYTQGDSVQLFAPVEPGDYEIRWLGAESPYPTLARQKLNVLPVSAQLQVPATAAIGTAISIQWQGPDNPRDFITLVPAGTREGQYREYVYASEGKSVSLTAPVEPGNYEIRYLTGRGNKTLGSAPIQITDSAASVQFASPARIGQTLSIQWTGPANPREFITVVKAGSRDGHYAGYTYVDKGNPLDLLLPEVPGDYEIRYMTADSDRVLARAPLKIETVAASVDGPATAVARSLIQVKWSGPDNAQDYIAITPAGKPASYIHYSYTARGNPVTIEVPKDPGDYDIHYLTANSAQSLAMAKLKVTPSATPGKLQVMPPTDTAKNATFQTVEVVLDASGSMLQKLDGKRRIDIAKTTLTQLPGMLEAGKQQFALRVFGHRKADSCDTELLLPPAPLDKAAISRTIGKLEAKNLARTPIADSLKLVQQDLANSPGKALVILLTDGEETCDGDPAAAIKQLRASGVDVRVNVIGFAIGEYALKQQFSGWAEIGGGTYFDAQDAAALQKALTQSLQLSFMVLDEKGVAIASGNAGDAALALPAGQYRVKAGGQELKVTITADETSTLTLP